MAKSKDEGLVWICGDKPPPVDGSPAKFDMVFIIGANTDSFKLETLRKKAAEAKEQGISTCIIGDGGKKSFLSQKLLQTTLQGRIDQNTSVILNAHGAVDPNFKLHYVGVYQPHENNQTQKLLKDLNAIFKIDPANQGQKMAVDIFSCHAGAAAQHAADDLKLTLHSTPEYRTLTSLSLESMSNAIAYRTDIKKAGKIFDPHDQLMHHMVTSPETVIYKESNKKFRAEQPQVPLSPEVLKRYLRRTLTRFVTFKRDELGHQGIKDDQDITQTANTIEMPDSTLARYNELALNINCIRPGFKNPKNYIETYIKIGGNIDVTSACGATPLLIACQNGHTEVVKALLEVGADTDKAFQSATPFYIACQNGHTEVVKALLEAGANKDMAFQSTTPFEIACIYNRVEILQAFKDAEARRDKTHGNKTTPTSQNPSECAGAWKGFLDKISGLEDHPQHQDYPKYKDALPTEDTMDVDHRPSGKSRKRPLDVTNAPTSQAKRILQQRDDAKGATQTI